MDFNAPLPNVDHQPESWGQSRVVEKEITDSPMSWREEGSQVRRSAN